MPMIRMQNAGALGVIRDLSAHELPLGAWTDASNIRFLDGSAYQFYGHTEVFASPNAAPQYVMPVDVAGVRYWVYVTAANAYAVSAASGTAVHTDITHATPRTGVVNQWTACNFGGIPIFNTGDTSTVPMYWDLNLSHKFIDLSNWPASTYCKSLRSYKNFLIALNVTKSGTSYPYMVKWSTSADPGTLPSSWDQTDVTKDAGEMPIPQGQGQIVDGLELRNSFIVYKEGSAHRLDYVGGDLIFSNNQIFGMSGLLNRNCVVEFDGYHLVVTASDIVMHDGYNVQSVLDKKARRYFFQNIDASNKGLVFVFKNPFLNEIFICYPAIGSSVCNRAIVYNYKDQTVSFRTLPNLNHAAFGPVDISLAGTWAADNDPWSADLTAWNGPDYTPDTARVIMGSTDVKLYLLDGSASFNGTIPSAYLERRGMGMDDDEHMKLIKSVRPRITGNNGDTVIIKVGGNDSDPYADPTYTISMTHTIGTTVNNDCMVEFRYPAIWIGTGTAYQWRLDSLDVEMEQSGMF